MSWTECPGQEPAAKGEMTVEYLTTRQVAERLRVPVSMVVHLLASRKLSGTKVGDKVANTRVGGERVHQSRVGKAPGNEVKQPS